MSRRSRGSSVERLKGEFEKKYIDIRMELKTIGVNENEWETFRIAFGGDTDAILAGAKSGLAKEIVTIEGTEADDLDKTTIAGRKKLLGKMEAELAPTEEQASCYPKRD